MVKNLLELLSSRQHSILSGAVILMVTVFAAKFLGLIRDRLLAHTFAPEEVAIFLAAFRLPDLLFQLLIFGAVSVAFIPVFTEYLQEKGESRAFEFASAIINVVLVFFGLISVVIFFIADPLTSLIVPGFSPEKQLTTASLTRIIMLGQVLLSVGAFYAGIAQSYQRFIVPSLAAVFYNLGVIIGIYFLVPIVGIWGAAYGVIVGAVLHIMVQAPLVSKLGFTHQLNFDLGNAGLREIAKMMSARTIGVAVEQLNETVGVILASIISVSSVTYLTFAQHLQTVPIGLFGATIAQAALPILSQERARGEKELFKATLLHTIHQILFLTLPATAILVVLRIPAVRLVFGASQFDWPSTVLTGRTVAFLALGLTAQALALLLMRGFYALKDTKTPVIVSVLTVTLNISLSLGIVYILKWEVWGLGIAYAISSNCSLVLLLYLLGGKIGGFGFKALMVPAFKMLIAALISAVALYIPIKALDQLVFDTTKTINLILLTGVASLFGLGVYFLLVWLMKVKEVYAFIELINKVSKLRSKLTTQEIIADRL